LARFYYELEIRNKIKITYLGLQIMIKSLHSTSSEEITNNNFKNKKVKITRGNQQKPTLVIIHIYHVYYEIKGL